VAPAGGFCSSKAIFDPSVPEEEEEEPETGLSGTFLVPQSLPSARDSTPFTSVPATEGNLSPKIAFELVARELENASDPERACCDPPVDIPPNTLASVAANITSKSSTEYSKKHAHIQRSEPDAIDVRALCSYSPLLLIKMQTYKPDKLKLTPLGQVKRFIMH
jgi:hypothetical protein